MTLFRRCLSIVAQLPPWLMSVLFTLVFLAVNGYKFGWDDQHLEIPLLKHLIDPSLFSGDYYVESLTRNFSSFFYPLLARLISVEQIPSTYLLLYLVSRYFLVYWIYKLWLHLASGDRFKASACVLTFILMARVQEFLYRTFSHQEFALAIIFAGIYYFFKERYFLSALILGAAANFHALYSLFPMFYISIYLLWDIRKIGWKKLFAVPGLYLIAALPFLIWTLRNRMASGGEGVPFESWFPLYITACPQNFFFPQMPNLSWDQLFSRWNVFYYFFQPYIHLTALLLLNLIFNPLFRENRRALAFCLGGFLLLIVTFVFTQVFPNRFVLDLNLIRTTQFLSFLLMGYTTILIVNTAVGGTLLTGIVVGFLFAFLKYNYPIMTSAVGLTVVLLIVEKFYREIVEGRGAAIRRVWIIGMLLPAVFFLGIIIRSFFVNEFSLSVRVHLTLIFVLLFLNYAVACFQEKKRPALVRILKRLFVAIPLLIFFSQYSVYHYRKANMELKGDGFWKLQRSWEDMQRYVKRYTPKEALIFVPYDMEMCGFRIQSERKVLVSYRDCGIVGFDYAAAEEWKQRVADVYAFKVVPQESVAKALQNAIVKYRADYVVFLRHLAPSSDNNLLERVYTNEEFALFKIHKP